MKAQEALSLDSCRALAISNNKELLISQEKINAAHYQRKAAFTNYLPNISASGGYMRSQNKVEYDMEVGHPSERIIALSKKVYQNQHK